MNLNKLTKDLTATDAKVMKFNDLKPELRQDYAVHAKLRRIQFDAFIAGASPLR